MTVVSTASDLVETSDLAVTLPLYAQIIGYSECSFYGVRRADPPAVHANKPLWRKSERDQVIHYLGEAQDEIENLIGYPLKERWFANQRHQYRRPLFANHRLIVEIGVQATTTFAPGEAVDHSADPAVVGPVATTVTDEDEIRVLHPGTAIEMYPSLITIALGFVTIEIPRCRTLTEAGEAFNNGVDYNATAPGDGMFEQTVDIQRVFNDPSTAGVLGFPYGTTCCSSCVGSTETACVVIRNHRQGALDVLRGTYTAGAWVRSAASCRCGCNPSWVAINYKSGLDDLGRQAQDTIIRLAHAKMPHSPCNCDPANWMWERDRRIPNPITKERLNCKFGIEDGAWVAYQFAQSLRVQRAREL